MAEETETPAGVPLGAKILRKLHGGLSSLSADITKMAGELDACEAKDAIGGLVGGLSSAVGEAEKHWGKFYKDHDIAAQDEAADETVKAEAPTDDDDGDDIDAALAALGDLDDDGGEDPGKVDKDDDEAAMTPEEKRAVVERIKKLESQIRHRERLSRRRSA